MCSIAAYFGGLRSPASPSQGALGGNTSLQELCGTHSTCGCEQVPHQIVAMAAFVANERCFFIFFHCLRIQTCLSLCPRDHRRSLPPASRKEFVPSLWCCFISTQKKSRFSGQKCKDMAIRMIVMVKVMKRCDILYPEQSLCDML